MGPLYDQQQLRLTLMIESIHKHKFYANKFRLSSANYYIYFIVDHIYQTVLELDTIDLQEMIETRE